MGVVIAAEVDGLVDAITTLGDRLTADRLLGPPSTPERQRPPVSGRIGSNTDRSG
jgi:hypothetical protein